MPTPTVRRAVLVASCLALSSAPSVSAGPESTHDAVVARSLDGASVRGAWVGLGEALELRSASGEVQRLARETLRDMRIPGPPERPVGDLLRATLVGGEVLVVAKVAPSADGLELTGPGFGTLQVPFDALRCLEALPSGSGPCSEPAENFPPQAGADHLQVADGDELAGTVLSADATGLKVELERGRERAVAWAQLRVVWFDNPAPAAAEVQETEVETRSGDLLRSRAAVRGGADVLEVPLTSDATLLARVPLEAVRAIRWRGGPHPLVDATRLAWTATLEPPFPSEPSAPLTATWPQKERRARAGRRPFSGCPLRLDGTTYADGFAVHGGSKVTLPLQGRFTRFEALVGVDDEAEEGMRSPFYVPGNVDVSVVGDGKVLWEAKHLRGPDAAKAVGPLDVKGVQSLVLVVDYGEDDVMGDRVTWAEPLLTR